MRNKKAWIFWESRRKYSDYSVISLCVYGNPGYNEGISRAGSILDVAVDMGILEKRGSWFSMGDVQIGQGREQTKNAIARDPQLAQKLTDAIMAKHPAVDGPVSVDEPDEMVEDAPVDAAN